MAQAHPTSAIHYPAPLWCGAACWKSSMPPGPLPPVTQPRVASASTRSGAVSSVAWMRSRGARRGAPRWRAARSSGRCRRRGGHRGRSGRGSGHGRAVVFPQDLLDDLLGLPATGCRVGPPRRRTRRGQVTDRGRPACCCRCSASKCGRRCLGRPVRCARGVCVAGWSEALAPPSTMRAVPAYGAPAANAGRAPTDGRPTSQRTPARWHRFDAAEEVLGIVIAGGVIKGRPVEARDGGDVATLVSNDRLGSSASVATMKWARPRRSSAKAPQVRLGDGVIVGFQVLTPLAQTK